MSCNKFLYFFTYTNISKDSPAKYYKRKAFKRASERYPSLSKYKKEKIRQYVYERYKNLPEYEK